MILDQLAASSLKRAVSQENEQGLSQMRSRAEKKAAGMPAGQAHKFKKALSQPGFNFICEVKRASPSRGVIAPHFPYLELAKKYETAGAAAISCLTEPNYFLGSDRYLQEIAGQVQVPVLRKDFILKPFQIYQAKVLGAAAVLLIVALLDTETLRNYLQLVRSLGMDALVEVHDADEIKRALEAGAEIIGINNRSLQDFSVDLTNSGRLRPLLPPGILVVAESGITKPTEIAYLKSLKIQAALIGEALMRSKDIQKTLNEFRKGCCK